MERDIIFRALHNGEWYYGNLSIFPDDKVAYISGKTPFNGHPRPDEDWSQEVNYETVGQYTGLKEKNGKEIYEGDIVRILYTDWPSKAETDTRTLEQYLLDISHIGVIEYHINQFSPKHKDGYFLSIHSGDHGCIEVVGNIYENPEIIKKENA